MIFLFSCSLLQSSTRPADPFPMAQPYREPVDDAHTDKEFPENLDAEKQNAEIVPAYEEPFGDEE